MHRRSGHVVAEKALKEVPAVVEELVGGTWGPEDWILVNPAGEQLDEMRVKLAAKLAAERDKKARKKAAKSAAAGTCGAAAGGEQQQQPQQQQPDGNGAVAGLSSSSGPSTSAAVGDKQQEQPGRKRPVPAAPAAASASSLQGEQVQQLNGSMPPPAKKIKKPVAMPSNATPSLYASLFTSSQPQEKETYLCRSVGARGVHLV